MRSVFLFLFLFLVYGFVYSQNNSIVVFGKPNIDEVLSVICTQDSSAEVELLYDKETIEFFVNPNNYYATKTIYYGRLKIYKKSGLDRGTIKFTQKTEQVDDIIIIGIRV